MAKGDKKVVFTQDFANQKKGSEVTFSRDLVNMLKKEGVIKDVETKAGKKPKTTQNNK